MGQLTLPLTGKSKAIPVFRPLAEMHEQTGEGTEGFI